MNHSSSVTVAQIVLDDPTSARVLQRHRIDYCCAGSQTLEAACAARGLSVDAVRADLDEAKRDRAAGPPMDPRSMSTRALLALIVGKHHGFLRQELPALTPLAAKVARVHGTREPKLPFLAEAVEELDDTLTLHLDQEEQVLFPGLADGLDVQFELDQMRDEHRFVAEILDRIHEMSDGFTAPAWACLSYRALTSRLSVLDADIRQHVHLENHVLAPRFNR
jgi:regulator of cell morphogenesis and NO signaling